MNTIQYNLNKGDYYNETTTKNAIVLHHTAGGSNPYATIDAWKTPAPKGETKTPIATSYVIGGSNPKNATHDGLVLQAFPDTLFAHHLGTHEKNNMTLEKSTIGIEICNFGPITKTTDGKFYNYLKQEMAADVVETLDAEWRGFHYYHKYTDKQIESLKGLLTSLMATHKIKKQFVSINSSFFALNSDALAAKPGIWTHVNYRQDKTDCWPSPALIKMLNDL